MSGEQERSDSVLRQGLEVGAPGTTSSGTGKGQWINNLCIDTGMWFRILKNTALRKVPCCPDIHQICQQIEV